MSAYGLIPAFLIRQARSKTTSVPVFHKSLFPVEGSGIFMLTLLDLFQFLAVLIICLPWWNVLWREIVLLSSISAASCTQALNSGSALRMGFQVRSTIGPYFRSRCTVHFLLVERILPALWYLLYKDILIPSSE